MNKKVLLVGIVVFVIGLVVLFAGPSLLIQFTYNNQTASLSPHATHFIPLSLPNSGILLLYYTSNNSTNMILMNASAYNEISSSQISAGSVVQEAQQLEGKGVLEIATNTTSTSYPYHGGSGTLVYQNPNVSITNAGVYYLVLQNNEGYAVSAGYTEALSNNIAQNEVPIAAYGGVTIMLLIVGICVVAYGILKKRPGEGEGTPKQEVNKLYATLDKEHTKHLAAHAKPKPKKKTSKKPKAKS